MERIDDDDYFRWVLSYVHLNPVTDAERLDIEVATNKLRQFAYSSYPDYFVGDRHTTTILNKDALPIPAADLESAATMLHELRSKEPKFQG